MLRLLASIMMMIVGASSDRFVQRWEAHDGQVIGYKGWKGPAVPVRLSGASWFGFETQDFVANGLWVHPVGFYLDTLKDCGINVLRIPFSAEFVLHNWDIYPYSELVKADPASSGLSAIQIMDHIIESARERGIAVMLDLHRLHKEYISPLWYSPTDSEYTSDSFFQAWFRILDHALPKHPNIIAIDMLNEPHDQATWGTGDYATDWRLFLQEAVPKIQTRYQDVSSFLVLVEGIEWGHTFKFWNINDAPLQGDLTRVVFSAHTYGKSVVPSTTTDPTLLAQMWDTDFGFLRDKGHTVMIGEWGGRTDLDEGWMNSLVDYLIHKNMTDTFFWSLGPNSGDVDGLLYNDWTTVDPVKKNLLKRLRPNPTTLSW